MAKKLGFMVLGIMMIFTLGAGKSEASELANNAASEAITVPMEEEHEIDNPVQSRFGFRWRCHDCGHVGAWQISYNTASKHAMAHHQRTGHRVFVYGV